MQCPTDERLVGYINGGLTEELSRQVEEHLLRCYTCQQRLPSLNLGSRTDATSRDTGRNSGDDNDFANEPQVLSLLNFAHELSLGAAPARGEKTTVLVEASDRNTGLPEKIGRYRVLSQLGAGSFGTVFLAQDDQLDRKVAVKLSHATRINTRADSERYEQEARLLAKAEHPNIVPVYDSGVTEDGLVYIVSRFIRGRDLSTVMKQERFPVERAVALIVDIATALHAVHTFGLIHRDIKPANILLDQNGNPLITDFGLATYTEEILHKKEIVGTLAYMSPEQLIGDGHLIGTRSDVFSVGVILFELLTHRRPFEGRSAENNIDWMIEPPKLRDINPSLPATLERICLKAIQIRASDRYATARDLAVDLQNYLESPSEDAERTSSDQPTYRGLRPFRAEDGSAFLELLPGLRSRQGYPESIQFWLDRLQGEQSLVRMRIGVLYGTTGSGKSSLIQAGVLPRLPADLTCIIVQASGKRTESDLIREFRRHFLNLPEEITLSQLLRHLRRREPPFANQRVLLVIDQFEQWLHGCEFDLGNELVQALRQCDGKSIQALLIVRDDFWIELSRFMQTVEEPLREHENMLAVEPFSPDHACAVLHRLGNSLNGATTSPAEQLIRDKFVRKAIELIQRDGKVAPVRLALFMEMTKELPWNIEQIRHFENFRTLGRTYIKQRFDPSTCPRRYRPLIPAVKSILRALIPDQGSSLKGEGVTCEELRILCGLEKSPERFTQLIDLLDSELRIISPVVSEEDSDADTLRYQLTHDYLVPAIRDWLNEEEVRTYQGRARLKLKDRTALWRIKQESQQLPGPFDLAQILIGTSSQSWTEDELRMIGIASKKLAFQLGSTLFVLFILIFAIIQDRRDERERGILDQLQIVAAQEIPPLLGRAPFNHNSFRQKLLKLWDSVEPGTTDWARLTLAKLSIDPDESQQLQADLQNYLLTCPADEFRVFSTYLQRQNMLPLSAPESHDPEDLNQEERFRIACLEYLGESRHSTTSAHAQSVLTGLISRNSLEIADWTEWLRPAQMWLVPRLKEIFHGDFAIEFKRSAAASLTVFLRDQPESIADLIEAARTPEQLRALLDGMANHEALLRKTLQARLAALRRGEHTSDEETLLPVLVALGRLRDFRSVSPDLQQAENPTLRNRLLHLFPAIETDPLILLQALRRERHPEVLAAGLLSLGSYRSTGLSESVQMEATQFAEALFQSHPDAEVHSAAWWLLTQLGQPEPALPPPMEPQTRQHREWFTTPMGLTMVVLSTDVPLPKNLTNPELPVKKFVIAIHETPEALFRLFDSEGLPSASSRVNLPISDRSAEDFMKFCNWLTLQEGLGTDALVYDEDEKGRMFIRPSGEHRRGYRFPFENEWEFAARGGIATPRICGSATELLGEYAWHLQTSGSRIQAVGQLKPNPFGLFDVLGNVSEVCHLPEEQSKHGQYTRVTRRGGSYLSARDLNMPYGGLDFVYGLAGPSNSAHPFYGLRLVRTIE